MAIWEWGATTIFTFHALINCNMAGPKTTITFSSLQKYTRKRQLYAKNGFYLSINPTGEVAGTSDESCLYAVLQFLSVGPDLVAIWGLKAKKYLAVDNKGRIFSSIQVRQRNVKDKAKGILSLIGSSRCHPQQGWLENTSNIYLKEYYPTISVHTCPGRASTECAIDPERDPSHE